MLEQSGQTQEEAVLHFRRLYKPGVVVYFVVKKRCRDMKEITISWFSSVLQPLVM